MKHEKNPNDGRRRKDDTGSFPKPPESSQPGNFLENSVFGATPPGPMGPNRDARFGPPYRPTPTYPMTGESGNSYGDTQPVRNGKGRRRTRHIVSSVALAAVGFSAGVFAAPRVSELQKIPGLFPQSAASSAPATPDKPSSQPSPDISPSSSSTGPVKSSSCTNPVWSSADAEGTWNDANFEVQNDAWSGDHGPQTIYACSYKSFYAVSNQTNTGGEVKTYPDTGEVFNNTKTVGSYSTITSTFGEAIQPQGEWDAAYDIWTNNWGNELMIWNDTHNHPEIPPSGSTAVTIDGVAYDAWQNGSDYTALMRDTKVQTGSVNILDVFKWLESKDWMKKSDKLTAIEYGVEVSVSESSPGVQGPQKFPITNFSLTAK